MRVGARGEIFPFDAMKTADCLPTKEFQAAQTAHVGAVLYNCCVYIRLIFHGSVVRVCMYSRLLGIVV